MQFYTPLHIEKKYYEYLKIDYPKVPFTDDKEQFYKLSKIGLELIDLHLMRSHLDNDEIFLDFVKAENNDDEISYTLKKMSSKERYKNRTIYLNDDLCIKGVDESVWNYTIGGYQVIDKWIKYRIDYTCSRNDLEHLVDICRTIQKTIILQSRLGNIYE